MDERDENVAEEVWGGNSGLTDNGMDDNTPYVRVNGENLEVDEGDNFVETIKNISIDAGFGKFRVYLNGEEIKPSQAPEFIDENMRIEVLPYDVPA